MPAQPIRLKFLLRERHWQVYRVFCAEYDKAAKTLDTDLMGTWPSRAQLHRWLSGELKSLPYPSHCRVLEGMFPGWTAQQLFEPWTPTKQPPAVAQVARLFAAIDTRIDSPDASNAEWGNGSGRSAASDNNLSGEIPAGETTDATQSIGRRLLSLSKVHRLSGKETAQLAGLAGNVVELSLNVDIDIAADGFACVSYHHELFNMTSRSLARLPRELWFENADGRIDVTPINVGPRVTTIKRIHEAKSLVKFACLVTPEIAPGEAAVISYTCNGAGPFVSNHYWRQTVLRYTRHLTITLRHRGVGSLNSCTAAIEYPDGSEEAAPECLSWDSESSDAVMTLTADYLRPSQAATIRWETARESS